MYSSDPIFNDKKLSLLTFYVMLGSQRHHYSTMAPTLTLMDLLDDAPLSKLQEKLVVNQNTTHKQQRIEDFLF